jgi:hypothetical protein
MSEHGREAEPNEVQQLQGQDGEVDHAATGGGEEGDEGTSQQPQRSIVAPDPRISGATPAELQLILTSTLSSDCMQ